MPAEMELLGTVRFELPSSEDQPPRLGPRFVDRLGRVWLSCSDTAEIHVFAARGERLFTCTPAPEDEGLRYRPYSRFHLTPEGHLCAGTRDAFMEFDAEGRRLACTREPRRRAPFVHPLAWADDWEVDDREIALVGTRPEERRVVRVPSGEARTFLPAAAAPDGGIAVCERTNRDSFMAGESEQTLHLFAPDGTHRATLDLPAGHVSDLEFDRERVVLLANLGRHETARARREIWSVAVEAARVDRARLPESLPEVWQISLSPDGGELWVFAVREPELVRFALPAR